MLTLDKLDTDQKEYIRLEAKKQLARLDFYEYCKLKYPHHYNEEKPYLEDVCNRFQGFIEQNEKRFLVISMPPRFYKSFTATSGTEWLLGKFPDKKIMTGSYNETLSTTFAKKVRNTIGEIKPEGSEILVYNDIFPETKIKYGEAAMSVWALEGRTQPSYLATSPGGTATGFGADFVLIDDIIKNSKEALNDTVLDGHWDWFTNTMMQRLEGKGWKFVIIMTRWATNDLAGRIIRAYPDEVEEITLKAINDDGTMLCESVLTRKDYDLKVQEMLPEIAEANYMQKPIDIQGRLYSSFNEWKDLPTDEEGNALTFHMKNYTDVADQGNDFLVSVNWFEHEDNVYIQDLYISDEDAEITEPRVAELLNTGDVNEAEFESNNGGKGYARNIERELEMLGNKKCVVSWTPQTSNKEARILASSAWNQKHVFMPSGWQKKYPKFFEQLMTYQKKGKNKFDDAPDVLAAIYERAANAQPLEWAAPRMG